MIYLLIRCDCTDGGSMGLWIRAFSTSEARDAAFQTPKYRNWECADVEADGAVFDRDGDSAKAAFGRACEDNIRELWNLPPRVGSK